MLSVGKDNRTLGFNFSFKRIGFFYLFSEFYKSWEWDHFSCVTMIFLLNSKLTFAPKAGFDEDGFFMLFE